MLIIPFVCPSDYRNLLEGARGTRVFRTVDVIVKRRQLKAVLIILIKKSNFSGKFCRLRNNGPTKFFVFVSLTFFGAIYLRTI